VTLKDEIERGPQRLKILDRKELWETPQQYARRLVLQALEEAAGICGRTAHEAWHAYKRGTSPQRANSHTEGISDGADACEQAIRAFAATLTPGQDADVPRSFRKGPASGSPSAQEELPPPPPGIRYATVDEGMPGLPLTVAKIKDWRVAFKAWNNVSEVEAELMALCDLALRGLQGPSANGKVLLIARSAICSIGSFDPGLQNHYQQKLNQALKE